MTLVKDRLKQFQGGVINPGIFSCSRSGNIQCLYLLISYPGIDKKACILDGYLVQINVQARLFVLLSQKFRHGGTTRQYSMGYNQRSVRIQNVLLRSF